MMATEELSEGLKEVFEKNGLTINEKGVYQIREKIFVPKCKKNNHKTISRRDDGRTSRKQANLLPCGKNALVAKMQQDVAEYVKICNECQRNKKRNHKPYGKMQSEKIPEIDVEIDRDRLYRTATGTKGSDNRRKM
jgi:hypothetical protein